MGNKSVKKDFLLALALVITGAILFSAWISINTSPPTQGNRALLKVGETAPSIQAAGWVNGNPIENNELDGKVIVVDAWATWCGPCRLQAPHMVETYQKFKDQKVIFIGLTTDDEEMLPTIRQWLKETGITWPNGYGARDSFSAFKVETIPQVWVIGANGKVVWNADSEPTESLEEGINRALSQIQ